MLCMQHIRLLYVKNGINNVLLSCLRTKMNCHDCDYIRDASLRPLIPPNPNNVLSYSSLVGFYQENNSSDCTVITLR